MAFLDPPYNVAYEGGTAIKMTIANAALGQGFLDFLRPALTNLLSVTKGASYVCMPDYSEDCIQDGISRGPCNTRHTSSAWGCSI